MKHKTKNNKWNIKQKTTNETKNKKQQMKQKQNKKPEDLS